MPTSCLLAAKDIRQRLRDRSAILIAVVVPLSLAFVLSLVFGQEGVPSPFRYGVVDLDRGPAAETFRTGALDALVQDDIATLRRVETADEARRLVESGALDAAFVLPSGFSTASSTAGSASLDVFGSVDAPTASEVARSVARSFTTDLNGARVAAAAAAGIGTGGRDRSELDPDRMAELAQRAAARTRPVVLSDVSAKTKILDSKTYLAAGMAIFFLFFTVQFGVSSLIEERTNGTLRRLLALPIRPSAILLSKLLTSLVAGVSSMGVLIAATTLLMGASFGATLGVALLVLTAVLAATGVTAAVASLARTAEQASSWQSIVATVLGLLGGTFFPVGQITGLSLAVLVTPHAWFLRGLAALADGGGPRDVLPASGALLAFALVTGSIGFLRLRKVVMP